MKIKIKNRNRRGFAALVTVLMLATALLMTALANSQALAVIFDEITLKQYRILATQNALACLDQSLNELEYDYFYSVSTEMVAYPNLHCDIVSVVSTTSGDINIPAPTRFIIVDGYSGISSGSPRSITAQIKAEVLIDSDKISLISSETAF